MDQPKAEDISGHVKNYYRDLYEDASPDRFSSLPITTGLDLALLLGYPKEVLDLLPKSYWEKFVPCGNPIPYLQPNAGDRILNLGCGAALDSFCLHAQYGNTIEIVGLDVVFSILQKSRATFRQLGRGLLNGENECLWVCGDAERPPFRSESFDWIVLNGVFNLFRDKLSLLGNIWRVLKTGGRLVGADLCCKEPLPAYFNQELDAWAWCMSGACSEGELYSHLQAAGFKAGLLNQEEEAGSFYRVTFSCCKDVSR